MNQFMQSLLSGAVATAMLWASANLAHAAPPPPGNIPPNYDKTQKIGNQLKSGEVNADTWGAQLVGQVANYNSYTEQQDETDRVSKAVKYCKDANGKQTFGCDFTQKNSGQNLLASGLLGSPAFQDDTQRLGAIEFVKNMTNNAPLAYPGDGKVFKDPKNKDKGLTDDGISYFASLFKQLPALSMAQNSLLALFTDRDRLPGLGGDLPVGDKGAASVLEMLNYEASRRYMDPAWFDAMNSATDQAVMREMAFMMAFQNYMAVKQYEQSQRMEALMVAQVSAINNMSNTAASASLPSNQKAQEKKMNQTGG